MYAMLNNNGRNRSLWDPTNMHIWCICHKLALIVNAGLQALSLKTLPPSKAKESILGFFPVLGKVTEEEEPNDPTVAKKTAVIETQSTNNVPLMNQYPSDTDFDSDCGNADNELSDVESEPHAETEDKPDSDAPQTKFVKTARLKDLTTKVCLSGTL
jgi:hypothetical protein